MKVKNFFRSLSCYFASITILITTGFVTPAFAKVDLPPGRDDEFGENNIVFYNPDGDQNCTSSTTGGGIPSGDQITWIGDSYSVGAQTLIDSMFEGADYGPSVNDENSYIQVGKHLSADVSGNPSGKTVVTNIAEFRKYVVFALGTNDFSSSSNSIKTTIDEIVDIIGEDKIIVLVTAYTKAKGAYTDVNAGLNEAKSAHSNIVVADWAAVAKDEYFDSDTEGIHPTGHYDIWMETIRNALSSSGSTTGKNCGCYSHASTVDGSTARDIAWNWFVNHPESGISDNAEAIAGVLGNFQAESHFNPFSHTSGSSFYGIYQTNSDGLKETIDAKGWESYWGTDIGSIPADIVEEAIDIELGILIGTGRWTGSYGYADRLDDVDHTSGEDGAASFAELFEVVAERAVCHPEEWCASFSQSLEDSKVIALTHAMYQGTFSETWINTLTYQGVANRRDYAREIFNELGGGGGGGSSCGSTRNNGDINATALELAWPTGGHAYNDPKAEYKNAMTELGIWNNTGGDDDCADTGGSCDVFVGTVMRYSGADPDFPIYLSQQKTYLDSHPEKYEAIDANTTEYKPGDIRIENSGGHIVLIVQKDDGSFTIASASHCDHSGQLSRGYYYDAGTIYRLKGN